MAKKNLSSRKFKNKILKLLTQQNSSKGLEEICQLPARKVINPLFSFLYSLDEIVKWGSITAFGEVVTRLAECDPESARIIMRRLMWNLNDESGGIGWGSPEAMGEIMARSPLLAGEYASILISYIQPAGNYLEHETLQRGVLWGLGRLAYARSDLVSYAAELLSPFLKSQDPSLRGHALWAAGALPLEKNLSFIEPLAEDSAKFKLFLDGELREMSIGKLAVEVLSKRDS